MKYRNFGRTGWQVSEIGFGGWAIGGSWGSVTDDESVAALDRAVDLGVNFIDTADVYGNGHSEQLIAQTLKGRNERIYVATKGGRRANPHVAESYTKENLTSYVERSLTNLQVDALDLIQLHCPPTAVYYMPEAFDALDDLVKAGKIRHYGVSVEKVEEGLKAMEYPNVVSVQIIFNMFRLRPAGLFFEEAKRREVAVIARVPLASGLLTGKMTQDTHFAKDDHRNFNRHGESFDRGETFSGVDYETGLEAVDMLQSLVPEGASMAQVALRWILMFEAVSVVIPGGKRPQQVEDNVAASTLPPLSEDEMKKVAAVYDQFIRPQVHNRW
ncbi:aldo/keto reductase [bacterium]|nr:aldo/keto reductase [bacterium]